MKVKTSVTLSEDLLKMVDRASNRGESRSHALERLLREGLVARGRRDGDERDRLRINEHADALNEAAADVLNYQADL
jgi:metal-responsive CopG/Arc/MetJ family transcriptional regulator